MQTTENIVFVDDALADEFDFGAGVRVIREDDRETTSMPGCVVVSDPGASVPSDVPVVLYTDADPSEVSNPNRFDAYVPAGDREALETQVRWTLARHEQQTSEETERVAENTRLKQLYEGTTSLVMAQTVEELFERGLDLADRILEFDNTSIIVANSDGLYIRASNCRNEIEGPIPPDKGVLGSTYQNARSYLVGDVHSHPIAEPRDPSFRSAVSVPIGDIGVFQAISNQTDAYDETDLRLAELLASYIAGTHTRIETEKQVRQGREQIERLHHGAARLAAATTLEELFERTVHVTDDILDFNLSYIGVVEDDHIVPMAISSDAPEDGAKRISLDDGGVAAKTHLTGETKLVSDMATDSDAKPVKQMYRSGLSVPIGDIAVFQATSYVPNAFSQRDAELTELLMDHVSVTAERIRAERNLRDERDRLGALFEHISDAAVAYTVCDDSVEVTETNQVFEEMFGYRADDIADTNLLSRICPVGPTSDQPNEEPATPPELLVGRGESYQGEVRRQTKNGFRDFILNVVPLSPGEERGAGYAIYTDITHRKARELELERQNERLEEFANIVSHDLRNPLGVARGNLELARETGDDDRFDTAANALDRMEVLIDDLLSLARRGQLVGDTASVSLERIAKRAWMTTETSDATLEVADSVTIDADPDRLAELLANLFRNAVKHAGDDVQVTVGKRDDCAGFYVEDDGPGIEPDRRRDVFQPGETSGNDGIGYGLAIVQSIADAHGWTCIVTDGKTGGARFEFETGR
ncbi:GAF domain-containing protein [Haloferax namakaokahaiae]|uniref:histidine kinase n=1 Tax=Haloferax namakaokahaiae TaxID=1748331 RepID=A0ABD5ZIH7_9EURY